MDKASAHFLLAFGIFFSIIGLCFATPLWLANYNFILHLKSRKTKSKIRKYSASDPFWNHDEMLSTGTEMFMHVQKAWNRGHFRHLANYISERQKTEWKYLWKTMNKLRYKFVFSKVNIEKTFIIGAVDHYDNERDVFQIAISGSIKRYLIDRTNGKVTPGNSLDQRNFIDILIFKRINDRWVLDEMEVDANLFHILKAHNKDFNEFIGEV